MDLSLEYDICLRINKPYIKKYIDDALNEKIKVESAYPWEEEFVEE